MKRLFISATDTCVGKTITTLVLATLFKAQGKRVGVLKPVQCAGNDAKFLKKELQLSDPIELINPYFAPEPLSPHLSLKRSGMRFDVSRVKQALAKLESCYDLVLIEGAGGLLVPLTDEYTNADLIRDLDAPVIIVSRRNLGTINHTWLTVEAARSKGLTIAGVIFSDQKPLSASVATSTNPGEIASLVKVPVLGTIPYLKTISLPEIRRQCRHLILPKLEIPSAKTNQLKQWDKKYVWHPFTQMKDWLVDDKQPLVIERGKGVYVYDTNGKRYIDGVSSLWVNVHGHCHPIIDEAIKKQVDKISHTTFLGVAHAPAILLAKQLIAIAPVGLSKVFYSDNGSTAVEIALKMAYQYFQNTGQTEKRTLVHLANAYHGDTLGSVSVGGINLFHQVYKGLIFKTHGLPGRGQETVQAFERYLAQNASTTAALVVEPLVQGAAGMLMWPNGTLKQLALLCKKHKVFLIVDEVATGFGRTGKMFACQKEGVTPDFLCLAKGITGGYLPLAATLTTQAVYDGFVFDYKDQKTFFHGHTYTANPLACAAALASLDVFKKEKTLSKLVPKIKYLAKRLKMFYNDPSVVEVRQCGFMVGIELKGRWEDRVGAKVCQRARDFGLLIRPLGNVIVLMPPLSITYAEIDEMLEALRKSICSQ